MSPIFALTDFCGSSFGPCFVILSVRKFNGESRVDCLTLVVY